MILLLQIKVFHMSKNVSNRTQGIAPKSNPISPECMQWLHEGIIMSVQSLSPFPHIGLCFMEMKSLPSCIWMINDWRRVLRHIARIGNTSWLKQWPLPGVQAPFKVWVHVLHSFQSHPHSSPLPIPFI